MQMMDKLEYIIFETRLSTYVSVTVIALSVLFFVGQVIRAIFF